MSTASTRLLVKECKEWQGGVSDPSTGWGSLLWFFPTLYNPYLHNLMNTCQSGASK
jgi:hypothetical protein